MRIFVLRLEPMVSSDTKKKSPRDLTTSLLQYVLTHHRSLLVAVFALPLSFLWDISLRARLELTHWWHRRTAAASHAARVREIVEQVKGRPEGSRICTARPGWQSMSLSYRQYKTTSHRINLPLLDVVRLDLDAEVPTVTVEPLVTMGQLSRLLLRHGFTLPVLPEMDDLTVGGLINGTGVESSSHRHGLFHEQCTAFELCLGDGTLVVADATQHTDLFNAVPWSYGTLGLLLSATIRVVRCKPFVRLECALSPATMRARAVRADGRRAPAQVHALPRQGAGDRPLRGARGGGRRRARLCRGARPPPPRPRPTPSRHASSPRPTCTPAGTRLLGHGVRRDERRVCRRARARRRQQLALVVVQARGPHSNPRAARVARRHRANSVAAGRGSTRTCAPSWRRVRPHPGTRTLSSRPNAPLHIRRAAGRVHPPARLLPPAHQVDVLGDGAHPPFEPHPPVRSAPRSSRLRAFHQGLVFPVGNHPLARYALGWLLPPKVARRTHTALPLTTSNPRPRARTHRAWAIRGPGPSPRRYTPLSCAPRRVPH